MTSDDPNDGDEQQENGENNPKAMPTMDVNEAHRVLGHPSEKILRDTLKLNGVKPTGTLKTCDGCARAKATQKRTNKNTDTKATKPDERYYMDTSGPYAQTIGGNRYWIKFIDDYSKKSFDFYVVRKKSVSEIARALFARLKARNRTVKFLLCDNAG